jgi:hypothetical protein
MAGVGHLRLRRHRREWSQIFQITSALGLVKAKIRGAFGRRADPLRFAVSAHVIPAQLSQEEACRRCTAKICGPFASRPKATMPRTLPFSGGFLPAAVASLLRSRPLVHVLASVMDANRARLVQSPSVTRRSVSFPEWSPRYRPRRCCCKRSAYNRRSRSSRDGRKVQACA